VLQALYNLSDDQAEYQLRDASRSCGFPAWDSRMRFPTPRASSFWKGWRRWPGEPARYVAPARVSGLTKSYPDGGWRLQIALMKGRHLLNRHRGDLNRRSSRLIQGKRNDLPLPQDCLGQLAPTHKFVTAHRVEPARSFIKLSKQLTPICRSVWYRFGSSLVVRAVPIRAKKRSQSSSP
jgi:hypothetical protein